MRITNEQIEKILSDAPEGASHVDADLDYTKSGYGDLFYYNNSKHCWDELSFVDLNNMRSLSELREILELRKDSESKTQRIMQFDKAISEIGAHIQKSEPGFAMGGVDTGDSQQKIIKYIKALEGYIKYLCKELDED